MATDIIRYTSVEKFIDRMPISKSFDHETLKKILFIEQDTSIQNLLGTNLYKALNKDFDDGNLTGKRLELIKTHVRSALNHLAFRSACLHGKLRLTDKGILEQSDTDASQTDKDGLHHLRAEHLNKAQLYKKLAVEFICENHSSFTEYDLDNEDGGIRPSKKPYFSGIQFG